jgi:hypothetical protein
VAIIALCFPLASGGAETRLFNARVEAASREVEHPGMKKSHSARPGAVIANGKTRDGQTPNTQIARLSIPGRFAGATFFFQGAANACDLNSDGSVNTVDVQLIVNMTLGISACTASVVGAGVCNVVVVQRIVNAALGSGCVVDTGHSVSLNWVASITPNVSYNVLRGTAAGGPYTKLNTSPVTGTAFEDRSVQSGLTYYYVVTAVDAGGNSSVYSNEALAVIPVP